MTAVLRAKHAGKILGCSFPEPKRYFMRLHFAIALTAALGTTLFASAAFSADTAQQGTMKTCAASWSGMAAGDKAKTKYKDYMSTCMKAPAPTAPGKTVAATPGPMPAMAGPAMKAAKPAKAAAAEAGSAKCKDGKVVTYTHRSGTCSGHGGVATWM
jgi:hypothetical protein